MAHLYYQFYLIDVRRNMVVCNEAYKIFQCNINLGIPFQNCSLNTTKQYVLFVFKYYFHFYFSIYEHDTFLLTRQRM